MPIILNGPVAFNGRQGVAFSAAADGMSQMRLSFRCSHVENLSLLDHISD
jgi:hypothetical protein